MASPIVFKKGREALAYIMAHKLGVHAWYCNAGDCGFEVAGPLEFVTRAIDKHAEQHRHDADLQRLGMRALGMVKPSDDLRRTTAAGRPR